MPCCHATPTATQPHYASWYLMGTTNEDVQQNYALIDEIYEDIKPAFDGRRLYTCVLIAGEGWPSGLRHRS